MTDTIKNLYEFWDRLEKEKGERITGADFIKILNQRALDKAAAEAVTKI